MQMVTRWVMAGGAALAMALASVGQQGDSPAPERPRIQRTQPPPWAPETPFTPIPHVEVFGRGPVPMVLIPGIAQDWSIFRTYMERNAGRYTMYAVTLPGFGDTAAPPLPENSIFTDRPVLENARKAIRKMIADFGIEQPVIGGYELGAHLALWMALETPEEFSAVVAIEGYPFVPLIPGQLHFDEDERVEHIKTKIVLPLNEEAEDQWRTRMRALAQSLVSDPQRAEEVGKMVTTPTRGVTMEHTLEYYMSDLRPGLPTLRVPLLVIAALRPERWFRPDIARDQWRALYATAPCTTLVFFNQCRPYVMYDAPEQLDQVVDEFLSGHAVTGGLVSSGGSCIPEGGVAAARTK